MSLVPKIIIQLLLILNAICKIAFITYAWLTMVRINAYIKEQRDLYKGE